MRIEVDKDLFLKSISIVDTLIPSRSVNDILKNCLFSVSKDEIEIIATDNEIGIKTSIDAVSDSEMSFIANGARFCSLLKELPAGVIIININESYRIDVKTKSSDVQGDFTLIGTSGDEYPKIPEFVKEGATEIEQNELKNMIKKVIYAAAIDTIKPFFNGIFFISQSNENLTLVATDSRRLSLITRNIKNEINLGEGIIVPLKAMHEINRLLATSDICQFSAQDNQCFLKIGRTEFVSRLIDYKFPNYSQVIPKDQDTFVTIKRDKLIESVRRAMIFTKEPSHTVVCNFNKDFMVIEVRNSELGECKEEIHIESNINEDMKIGLNARFLYDSIKEMESESIKIGITAIMSPVTFVPDNDPEFISVIMPLKVKSMDND